MVKRSKIAFGGGCHWCTEAVFQSLIGVEKVEQGFVSSEGENSAFSEAVIVHYYANKISINKLIEIHLHTHKSTSNHSMRNKYRSAIYVFSENQKKESQHVINHIQKGFEKKVITQILNFNEFKISEKQFINYYYSNPEKSFCKTFINPKLKLLLTNFSNQVDTRKLKDITP